VGASRKRSIRIGDHRVETMQSGEPVDRKMDPRFQLAQVAPTIGDLRALPALVAADSDLATAVSSQSHPTLL
jgi:hypothetical protein